MTFSRILVAAIFVIVFTVPTLADVPSTMHVQGRLTDASDAPAPGDYRFVFKIFNDPVSGDELWPRAADEEMVRVEVDSNGLWNAVIGEEFPIPVEIYSDSSRWLEIVVDDGKTQVPLPRVKLHSGPFSFRTAWSQEADLARGLSSNTVSSTQIVNGSIGLQDLGQNGAAAGNVMKWNGSAWEVSPDIGASGDYVLKTGDIMTGYLIIDETDSTRVHVSGDIRAGKPGIGAYRDYDQSGAELYNDWDFGGALSLYGFPPSGLVKMYANQEGGGYLHLRDSTTTRSIILSTGSSGDLAARFPEGAISGEEIADGSLTLSDLGPNGAVNGDVITYQGGGWSVAPGVNGSDYVQKTGDNMTGSLYIRGADNVTDLELATQFEHGQISVYDGISRYIRLEGEGGIGHPMLSMYEDKTRAILGVSSGGCHLYLYDSVHYTPSLTMGADRAGGYLTLSDSAGAAPIAFHAEAWRDGNPSVHLPDNSVARDETWDEPGVAQRIDSTSTISLSGTGHDILHRYMPCPRDGYVMATATAQVQFTHLSGTASAARLGLSTTSGVLTAEQRHTAQVAINATTGVYAQIVTVQKIFEVGATKEIDVYFVGDKVSGMVDPIVSNLTLSLMYIPTRYGTFEE